MADAAAPVERRAPAGRAAPAELAATPETFPAARDEARSVGKVSNAPAVNAEASPAQPPAMAAAPPMAALTRNRALATTASSAAFAPLADALASIAAQPQRWAWQRGGDVRPLTPALQRWLGDLERDTSSRWRAHTSVPVAANDLRLFRDGSLHATLRLTNDAVWLLPAAPTSGPAQAPLAPAALAELSRTLDLAAP